jgi:penicillin amidase
VTDSTGSGRGRRLRLAAGGLAALAILVALGLQGVRSRDAQRDAFPLAEGAIAITAVERPVTVYRDARGVPHVEAGSERDALAGLGFVHAQDRLGQMLWLRQRARGRAAEVLGEDALDADRMARTVGFPQLAAEQLPRLDPEVRLALGAYADGVNARIERIRSGLVAPPLWAAQLGLDLDPWRPEDSLAVFKLYAWSLGSSVEAVVVLSEMIQRLGPAAAGRFFPGGGLGEALPARDATVGGPAPASGLIGALRRGLAADGFALGSSAWVLGGAHTASGWPMLAADHHLPASLPAWLHLDHVRGGKLDVAGATLPGVPVFWSGRNPRVAWGAVAAGAVVTDLYVERLGNEHPDRYHDGRRWRDLAVRDETIRVRGEGPVRFQVRKTFHGPLLPGGHGGEPLSVAWTGARVDGPSGIGSLLAVARANDALELLAALESHHEPVLAVVYADAVGAAGMQVAGWIPHRSLSARLQPLQGRARWYTWSERIPFEALPSARLLDGEGWLIAADASLAPRGRAPIDWLWHSGARAARIESLLRDAARRGQVDLRSMSQLQNDVGGVRARRVVESIETIVAAIDQPLGPQATELAEILAGWDGAASAGSQGAAAYHVLVEALAATLVGRPLGEDLWQRYLGLPRTDPEGLLAELLAEAAADATAGGESVQKIAVAVREGLREAWLRLSFRLAVLGPHPYPGTAHTVRAGPHDPHDPFEVSMASTARFAFDTGSLDQSLVILAPGQSEHPGHPHFDDQVGDWLEGSAGLLATGALLVEETSVARLVLEPVR